MFYHIKALLGLGKGLFGSTESRPGRSGKTRLRLETLEDRQAPSATPGTVVGTGTLLKGQDSFQVNVAVANSSGDSGYTGSITFSDTKANVRFTSKSISSIQI